MRFTCLIVLVLMACGDDAAPDCMGSDPTGAEGSSLIQGCPCSVDASEWLCCQGGESSFSCDEGTWRAGVDGCNPLCSADDGGLEPCSDVPPQVHVSCSHLR